MYGWNNCDGNGSNILKNQGEQVNAVFLFETYNWCALPSRNSLDRFYYSYQKIVFHFNNLLLLKWDEKKLFLANKWNELKSRKNLWISELRSHFGQNQIITQNYDGILAKIWEQNDKAAFKYQSKKYDGEVYQFLPKKRYQIHSNKLADWDILVRKIKVINLPLFAAGMLVEPFVKILAQEINDILKKENI